MNLEKIKQKAVFNMNFDEYQLQGFLISLIFIMPYFVENILLKDFVEEELEMIRNHGNVGELEAIYFEKTGKKLDIIVEETILRILDSLKNSKEIVLRILDKINSKDITDEDREKELKEYLEVLLDRTK